jgi:hypothetical protein
MNLVTDDKNIVLDTDVAHSLEFFPGPYTAARIVGVTKQEELAFLYFLLKIVKINLELTVYELQRVEYKSTLKVMCHMMIGVVHRWLYHHLVAVFRKALHSK